MFCKVETWAAVVNIHWEVGDLSNHLLNSFLSWGVRDVNLSVMHSIANGVLGLKFFGVFPISFHLNELWQLVCASTGSFRNCFNSVASFLRVPQ